MDIAQIPILAGKGTDVLFIEKRGALEIVKYISDEYGIAFVNTQGHFAEYPKGLITEIVNQGGRVAILTDFDCSGIHIAETIGTWEKQEKKIEFSSPIRFERFFSIRQSAIKVSPSSIS